MQKPKRPARRPRLNEDERSLRELSIFVGDAVGFRMGVATYDTPRTRDVALARLDAIAGSTIHLSALDLAPSPNEKLLLTRLKEHLRDNPTPPGKARAIMVVNLEATLDYRTLNPDADENMAILANANMQRDAYPELCPVSVVFWLNPTATVAFAQHAPDLYDWRSATFRFTGQAEWSEPRLQLEFESVTTPFLDVDRVDKERKRERIAMLRDLLIEREHAADADSLVSRLRRGAILSQLGQVHFGLGEIGLARGYHERELELAREIGDRGREGGSLNDIGITYIREDKFDEAIRCHEQSLVIAEELGDRRMVGNALGNLGVSFRRLGRPTEAIGCFERHIAIARELGDRRAEAVDLGNLGSVHLGNHRADLARPLFEEALAIARELGDRRTEAAQLNSLGRVAAIESDFAQAITLHDQALTITHAIGDRVGEGLILMNLGSMYVSAGQARRAIECSEQALEIWRETGDLQRESTTLIDLGLAYASLGLHAESADRFRRAIEVGVSSGDAESILRAESLLSTTPAV